MKTATANPNRNIIERIFIEHPESVDETYFQHLGFAGLFAGKLMLAGLAAIVHAIIPALCQKTASNIIRELYSKVENRGAH